MKTWLTSLILIATSFVVACAPGSPGELSEAERTELKDLNREVLERMIEDRDPTPLQEVAYHDFLVIAPGGVVETLDQVVGGVESFSSDATVAVSDQQVLWRDGVAVVIGKLVIDGEMRPVGELPPLKFLSVFLHEDGQWRLMARTLTACFEMAIERGLC